LFRENAASFSSAFVESYINILQNEGISTIKCIYLEFLLVVCLFRFTQGGEEEEGKKSVPFIVPLELGPTPTTIHNPTHIAAGT